MHANSRLTLAERLLQIQAVSLYCDIGTLYIIRQVVSLPIFKRYLSFKKVAIILFWFL
jgi:hypothetical protein